MDNEEDVMRLERNTKKYQANLAAVYYKMYQDDKDEWTDQAAMRIVTRFLSNFLNDFNGIKILDIGCGAGRDSLALAERGARVTGIDIIPQTIWPVLEKKYPILNFVKASLFNFKSRELFDVTLDNGCMHHQHPDGLNQYIKRIHSLLSSHGIFLISTFYNGNSSIKLDANGRVMRTFTVEELKDLVDKSGFKQLEHTVVDRTPLNFHYLLTIFKKQE